MTTKIFWPDDLPLDAQDVLYGWKLATDWFVVAFGVSVRPSHVKTAVEEKGAGSPAGYPLIRLNEIRQPSSLPYQYILYKCPNIDRLRFFATQPLELDTGTLAKQSGPQYSLSNRLSQLYEYYPSPSKGAATRKLDTGHLDTTLSLINETYRVRKDVAAITEAQSRRGARAGEHAPSALNSHSLAVRTLSDINFRLFTQLSALTSWINVILFLPCAKVLINIAAFSAVALMNGLLVSFYNTVWLIANDLIVGWTISAILKEHTPHIEHVLNGTVRDWLMTRIIAGLQWLDDWPVGLKLNAPLSRLFAGTYAGITTAWLSIIEYLPITTSALVWLLTSLSLLGVSMFISTLLDILSLASLHLRAATSMSGVIYRAEMAALYALWNLFRGKQSISSSQCADSD
ncbi:hypothetical protein QFC19_002757 [Naganishia cerealis]|uniref:Uncharacterized protein n=1 Tax=Naganishia cerealis TaxID=610337 RepID=A0ACC2W9W3_9TREE|nr:hypothetical protein QFC19_002757 [Naganishia cerealis]